MLDVCPIRIRNNAMIGPNCQFLTPPPSTLDTQERNLGIEYGKPVLSETISGLEVVLLSFLEWHWAIMLLLEQEL